MTERSTHERSVAALPKLVEARRTPIGSLTSTAVLDLIGGQRARRATDRPLTLGLAADGGYRINSSTR